MRKLIAFLISVVMLFGMVAVAEDWVCPSCGNKATGNFCNNCGMAATSVFWTCPQCGNEATGNFCNNCGAKKPEEEATAVTEAPQEENHEPVDESESTPALEPELSREELLEQYWKVGNIITFGRYEQDDNSTNGPEEIEWIILDYDKANQKVFLLSKYGLDIVPYNTKFTRITWEKSSLRAWLNSEFLNKAFNAEEQSAILSTTVNNGTAQGYSKWNIDGGKSTQDQIFLLSYAEANHYLGLTYDKSSINAYAAATEYAIEQGACVSADYQTDDGKGTTWWWLRSPGGKQGSAARVDFDGSLYSCNIDKDYNAVRPALWLDINRFEPTDMRYMKEKTIQSDSNDQTNHTPKQQANDDSTANSDNAPLDNVDPGPEAESSPAPEISADQVLNQYKKTGNIVTFGTYPQTKTGKDQTPIEWVVLDYNKTDQKVLLISKYGLDVQPYNDKFTNISWENCSLRAWLNKKFLDTAFSAEEQTAILTTKVDNSASQGYDEWDPKSEKDTQDKIFLLSYMEAHRYLGVTYEESNMKSRAAPTDYAKAHGAYTLSGYETVDGEMSGDWWLRSHGFYKKHAIFVRWDGTIYRLDVNYESVCVRPVFWLDLTKTDVLVKQVSSGSSKGSEPSNAKQNDNAVSKTVKAGDTLFFGRFEQDNNTGNGPEQIEWRVLSVEKGQALLVSKYCLDEISYWDGNDALAVQRHGINWSTSYIRQWLNGEFYSKSFTEEEKTRIPVSDVYTNDRSGKNTTKDRVFILSASEVEKYFSGGKDANAPVTEYARSRVDESRGAVLDGVNGIWWLRDMMSLYKEADKYDFLSGEYNEAGYVCTDGLKQYREGLGIWITAPGLLTVRPAMWIRTDGTPEPLDQTEAASNPPEQEDLSGKPEIGIDKAKEIGKAYFDSHFAGKGKVFMSGCQTNAAPVDGHDCYNVFYFLENQDMYSIYVDKKSGEIITVIFENGNGQKVLK